jgi:hypothetical protein
MEMKAPQSKTNFRIRSFGFRAAALSLSFCNFFFPVFIHVLAFSCSITSNIV